jgi:hypothetical protein
MDVRERGKFLTLLRHTLVLFTLTSNSGKGDFVSEGMRTD